MTKKKQELDWVKAEAHLVEFEKAYRGLVGMPNVNPFFAIGMIGTIRRRFDRGERTPELYQEIMDIE